jgi:DNA-directed RNA polymerase subunit D
LEVNVLEKEGNSLNFFISGISTPMANALRRIMIAEVPSMAIDDVVIIENTSVMNDEVLALRLGLIPLKSDLDSYVPPEECTCQSELGCNKCSVTLTLEAEAEEETRTVYSRELKSSDADIFPVSGDIPILKLAHGQKIRLEAYAKLGRGKVHAKWQPVSACTHKYASAISIDRRECDLCGRCIEACSRNILRADGEKIIVSEAEKCDLCEECMKACPIDAIRVERIRDSFIFTIESTGALTPERVVYEANRILKDKTTEFHEQLLKIKPGGDN